MLAKVLTNMVRMTTKPQNFQGLRAFNFSTSATGVRDYTPANKKYLQPWELERKEYVELSQAIQQVYSCKMLGEVLKDNLQILTDYQLSFALFQLWNHEITIDSHFYNVVSPILKQYIKNFDRECNKSLGEIGTYLGRMNVQDDGLWALIEEKLLKEKLIRYIPLNDLIDLAHAFATANRGSQEFYNIVENVIIKHRLRLSAYKASVALDLFTHRKIGSPLLFQVLADPQAPESQLTGLADREKLKISG